LQTGNIYQFAEKVNKNNFLFTGSGGKKHATI